MQGWWDDPSGAQSCDRARPSGGWGSGRGAHRRTVGASRPLPAVRLADLGAPHHRDGYRSTSIRHDSGSGDTTTTVPVVATTLPATTTTTTMVPVDEVEVLTASYVWGPSRAAVLLQTVLGVEADGWYGPGTRRAHVAENEARGLSIDAVPSPPPTTVPPPSTTAGMFGGLGAKLVAQLLGQPCIADGDLSDCGPEVDALVKGLVN